MGADLQTASGLDRPFKHTRWYLHSNLTVREFLELAAESNSFYVERTDTVTSDKILGDTESAYFIRCDDDDSSRSITKEEYEYFRVRREFWMRWHEDFANRFFSGTGSAAEYLALGAAEKKKIPEYKRAIEKVV